MRTAFTSRLLILLLLAIPVVARAANDPDEAGSATNVGNTSAAGGKGPTSKESPALTGVRRPLYRLQRSDVVDLQFTFSPEFNQTLTVQPDGFIAPRGIGDIAAEGLTIAELRDSIRQGYAPILRDPEVTVILRDFDKPFFLAGGQVGHPGKYELRSPTTVSEAIAIAGGFNDQARHSQVVLFRKVTDGVVESHVLNVKTMLATKNLEEDIELKPGDMVFVPQNRISKIKKFLPVSSLSAFLNPGL
jgi:polysaccharide biosynthesis/export protein